MYKICVSECICMWCAELLQLCPTLCDFMDCSPPGSSVHGILQARILEWVAMPSSRGSSEPRDRTQVSCVSCIGRQVLYHQHHQGSRSRCTSTQMYVSLSTYDVVIIYIYIYIYIYVTFSFHCNTYIQTK